MYLRQQIIHPKLFDYMIFSLFFTNIKFDQNQNLIYLQRDFTRIIFLFHDWLPLSLSPTRNPSKISLIWEMDLSFYSTAGTFRESLLYHHHEKHYLEGNRAPQDGHRHPWYFQAAWLAASKSWVHSIQRHAWKRWLYSILLRAWSEAWKSWVDSIPRHASSGAWKSWVHWSSLRHSLSSSAQKNLVQQMPLAVKIVC